MWIMRMTRLMRIVMIKMMMMMKTLIMKMKTTSPVILLSIGSRVSREPTVLVCKQKIKSEQQLKLNKSMLQLKCKIESKCGKFTNKTKYTL